jgi:GNAT superfamily N-acetyltransferase
MVCPSPTLAFTANADAWQYRGLMRAAAGGAVAELGGVRLVSPGLPGGYMNSGDVHDPSAVDLDEVRDWYRHRGDSIVLRVPDGLTWTSGRRFGRRDLMAAAVTDLIEPTTPTSIDVLRAGPSDLDDVVAVDVAAFGDDGHNRDWIRPHLVGQHATVALIRDGRVAVATGYSFLIDGWAGPSLYIGGVGVVPSARRRGLATALTWWLLRRGAEAGAAIVVLQTESPEVARLYRRFGLAPGGAYDLVEI